MPRATAAGGAALHRTIRGIYDRACNRCDDILSSWSTHTNWTSASCEHHTSIILFAEVFNGHGDCEHLGPHLSKRDSPYLGGLFAIQTSLSASFRDIVDHGGGKKGTRSHASRSSSIDSDGGLYIFIDID